MKKAIVVIILAVYVASIAVVNFMGLKVEIFDGITYVTSIQCDSVTFHGDNSKKIEYEPGSEATIPLFIFDFIEAPADAPYTAEADSLTANPNIIQINYEVMPHLADEAGIKFEYDENSGIAVFHELSGSFVFLKPGSLNVTIKATDGSNVSTTIRIKGRLAN